MAGSQDKQLTIRSLPHDDDAEKSILGTLLLNPDAWDTVQSIVEASDFYSPANKVIFQSLFNLVNEEGKQNFDGMILIDYLRRNNLLDKAGGVQYISLLTSLSIITANIKQYCDIVKEDSRRRLLYKVSSSIQESVFDPSVNIEEKLEEGSKVLNDAILQGMNESAEEYEIGSVLFDTFKAITDKMEGVGEEDRIETGFDVLDRYTNGGFAKEEYVIIAARPSIGKTAFALSMMYNMINNNKKVAFFSLEMPAVSIAKRLFAIDSKIELSKIMKASFLDDEYQRLMDSVSRLYEVRENMFIVDVPNISLSELRTKARILKKERNIDCIVIDYIGLISVPSSYSSQKKFEQVSYISLSLKQLARELKVPVIVLCQVGRESEEQAPILSNLRDSGSIEQDADIVCFLHRKKTLSEEEKQRNLKDSEGRANIQVTKFIVAKNRNGETGFFTVGYNGPLTYYADVDQKAEFIDYEQKGPNSNKRNN